MSAVEQAEEVIVQLPQTQDASAAHIQAATTNNAFVLKKLTQKHKDAIVLSLQGMSREQIAEVCGRTPAWVTLICKQPLAKQYIAELEQHLDMRLRGMYERSITTIENVMTGARKDSDKLAAAFGVMEAIGKRKLDTDENKQTAEDVVSAMLIQGSNVQVNVNRR